MRLDGVVMASPLFDEDFGLVDGMEHLSLEQLARSRRLKHST